jgi:hypothetical protein
LIITYPIFIVKKCRVSFKKNEADVKTMNDSLLIHQPFLYHWQQQTGKGAVAKNITKYINKDVPKTAILAQERTSIL